MANAQTPAGKNRDIEMLRAVAISFVMFFHLAPHALARLQGLGTSLADDISGLWSGVDLFFCVSGYVITRSLLREQDTGSSFSAVALPFWIRRVFRLWPGAWLWAAIAVALSHTFNATGLFGAPAHTARDAWMAVLNLANFHEYFCLRDHTCGALRIYWSLSLEEQFYWILPFVVFLCTRRALAAVLVGVAASQVFLERPMAFMSVPNLLWFVRSDAICLGALAAMAADTQAYAALRPMLLRRRTAVSIAAAILMALLATIAAPRLNVAQSTGVLAVLSGLLVLIASYDESLILPRIKMFEPVLRWLGSRSYSLYLVHDVAGTLAAEVRARSPSSGGMMWALCGLVLTAGLTFGLAELNFRMVEMPLRRYGRSVANRRSGTPHGRVADRSTV